MRCARRRAKRQACACPLRARSRPLAACGIPSGRAGTRRTLQAGPLRRRAAAARGAAERPVGCSATARAGGRDARRAPRRRQPSRTECTPGALLTLRPLPRLRPTRAAAAWPSGGACQPRRDALRARTPQRAAARVAARVAEDPTALERAALHGRCAARAAAAAARTPASIYFWLTSPCVATYAYTAGHAPPTTCALARFTATCRAVRAPLSSARGRPVG